MIRHSANLLFDDPSHPPGVFANHPLPVVARGQDLQGRVDPHPVARRPAIALDEDRQYWSSGVHGDARRSTPGAGEAAEEGNEALPTEVRGPPRRT